ncbi:MAG: hypothetical protein A2087_06620 [Spirochaetes bacterium GWD1_61_31]|nr:MAG: hypothetical protein A2Y37_08850 [Spirochaetes bacterium GWB1_60_80]OHD31880.1 MAG: hypothetical protein A2004_10235 [Spirochaetes bacterium GWC1_61_12]OHD40023.1 MAG: hypothetical protein A2087_06620 [Spirochaetes bacterium GWD1_61_31]OHD42323.1 MAG: hypothetical protein A2Y35_11380 [Spirochaetes bacterium GWE1_60_18]OHD58473.1 MAG: hypothetical protein A2Y32_06885 [Spirochaetes bacterium GWF1_60_12]HAW85464.1 undecaprenyl/decaprenyl-phosphate alpha-N-acetylglucosaminyl 1-phosphate tr
MRTLLPGLVAGLFNILIIPLIIVVARKRHWFDKPDERKIHTNATARLGGFGIFWSFILAIVVLAPFSKSLRVGVLAYWPILLAMLAIHLLGLLDDFFNLRARIRFVVQMAAAVFVVAMGYRFSHLWLPGFGSVALGWLSWPLTVCWIVGVLNALNMIDGMDGLSGGITIIAAFGYGLILLERQADFPALMAFGLVGALAGFLFYNLPPAKIFMGDSGSTFLGFTLAVLPLMDTGHTASGTWLWGGATLLLIPIFDVFAAMLRRKRGGVPLMSPDKWHIHHKLMHFGFSTRAILAILYSLCILVAIASMTVLVLPTFWYWVVTMASWAGVAIFFLILHYKKEKSLRS